METRTCPGAASEQAAALLVMLPLAPASQAPRSSNTTHHPSHTVSTVSPPHSSPILFVPRLPPFCYRHEDGHSPRGGLAARPRHRWGPQDEAQEDSSVGAACKSLSPESELTLGAMELLLISCSNTPTSRSRRGRSDRSTWASSPSRTSSRSSKRLTSLMERIQFPLQTS